MHVSIDSFALNVGELSRFMFCNSCPLWRHRPRLVHDVNELGGFASKRDIALLIGRLECFDYRAPPPVGPLRDARRAHERSASCGRGARLA